VGVYSGVARNPKWRGEEWEAILGGSRGQPSLRKRVFGFFFPLFFLPSVSLIRKKSLSMGKEDSSPNPLPGYATGTMTNEDVSIFQAN